MHETFATADADDGHDAASRSHAGPAAPACAIGGASADHYAGGREGDGPRLVTLGCRLNAYESEVMRRHASAAGLDNAVIVNTCAEIGRASCRERV